mgnify:CR=1 FL=1
MKHTISIILSLLLSAAFSVTAFADGLRLGTVVIDAGHGGKDPGCISKDKKTYEKNLTLDIATRFSDLIKAEFPDIKVILTRSTDKFVELRERADIANRANANLFISLHINASSSISPNGYSVHILGQSSQKNRDLFAENMDIVKRENSVILLEDDYQTHYQGFNPSDPESYIFMSLMQNSNLEQSLLLSSIISEKLKGGPIKSDKGIRQNPFYVLWRTSMPAVLVEMGFISNDSDLSALRQEEKRADIAKRLLSAFKDYKQLYDSSLGLDKEAPAPAAPVTPAEDKPASGTLYGTQIFATSKPLDTSDKRFLGWKPYVVRTGNLYKYVIGVSDSPEEARKNNAAIKKEYPSSFMVEISDGVTKRK